MGVGKVGVLHAMHACPLIHQGHKDVHTAGDRLGQNIAGLIGGGGEGAVEDVLQPDLFPLLDILGGTAVAHLAVNLGAHGDHVVQGQLTADPRPRWPPWRHDLGELAG